VAISNIDLWMPRPSRPNTVAGMRRNQDSSVPTQISGHCLLFGLYPARRHYGSAALRSRSGGGKGVVSAKEEDDGRDSERSRCMAVLVAYDGEVGARGGDKTRGSEMRQ
jgi:hypothetical protein